MPNLITLRQIVWAFGVQQEAQLMLTNPRDAMLQNYNRVYVDLQNSVKIAWSWVIAHYRFSKWRPSAILDFYMFAIFCKKNQIGAYFYVVMQNLVKFWRSTDELLRIFYFKNGGRLPSWIFIFGNFFFVKIQICAYIFVVLQNLVKIGRCAAELLYIFDFQNAGRPPSWIFVFS